MTSELLKNRREIVPNQFKTKGNKIIIKRSIKTGVLAFLFAWVFVKSSNYGSTEDSDQLCKVEV